MGEDVTGVFGSGPNDVYAVSSDGKIIHFNGTSWSMEYEGSSGLTLNAIWLDDEAPGAVFTVGGNSERGIVVKKTGKAWLEIPLATIAPTFTGVWGINQNDVCACGGNKIWRAQDGSWAPKVFTASGDLQAIDGTGSAVWAVGTNSAVAHKTSSGWSEPHDDIDELVGNDFRAVTTGNFLGDELALTLGDHGAIHHFSVGEWAQVNNSDQYTWNDLCPGLETNIFGVKGNKLMMWSGEAWTVASTTRPGDLLVSLTLTMVGLMPIIWATGYEELGVDNPLLAFNSVIWSRSMMGSPFEPTALSRVGESIYVSGRYGGMAIEQSITDPSGYLMPEQILYPPQNFYDTHSFVDRASIVGGNGTILTFNESEDSWIPETSNTTSDLYGVWFDSDLHGFAVGANGTTVELDVTGWQSRDSHVNEIL